MKRRDVILASVGMLVPALGRAAQPCPPPQVSVAGGATASTTCVIAPKRTYSTNFAATENPISEGGVWTRGGVEGRLWTSPQTIPGVCFPTQNDHAIPPYDDSIACLSGFAANQKAKCVLHRNSPAGEHEVEMLLRFQISSGLARGYEVSVLQGGTVYVVRWNGALNDYTQIAGPISTNVNAGSGATWEAQIVGSVLTVTCNGAQV